MAHIVAVAEYRDEPCEGMQVVSKTLVDSLRQAGHTVRVVEPAELPRSFISLMINRPDVVLFTHGPGSGVVAFSLLFRKLLRAQIIWVASRPDLATLPRWLKSHKTAHSVVCNKRRPDLEAVARGTKFIEQYIGIDPARVESGKSEQHPWPDLLDADRPVLLHVGHLKRDRGLDVLADAKRNLGERIEVIVQGGPALPTDPEVVKDLETAGVRVRRTFEPNLRRLYGAADSVRVSGSRAIRRRDASIRPAPVSRGGGRSKARVDTQIFRRPFRRARPRRQLPSSASSS